MIKIQTSLDWPVVQSKLETPAKRLGKYNREMLLISRNIGYHVKMLSCEEINCRRYQKQTQHHKELVNKINEEIDSYNQLITFALLLTK